MLSRFVFCDGGTKKHPKIYGFLNPVAASRAFDILTCRRLVEKGKPLAVVIEAGQVPITNFPLSEYAEPKFEYLITSASRDDIIYGLKQAAKRNLPMDASTLLSDMTEAINAATKEAEEKLRLGEPRQSYEPTAPNSTSTDRKRKPARAASAGGAQRRRRGAQVQGGATSGVLDAAALQLGAGGDLGGLPLLPNDISQQLALAQFLVNSNAQGMLPGLLSIGNGATPGKQDGDGPDDRPTDGLAFAQELCRLAAQNMHPELACAADMLRIWEVTRTGGAWNSEQYTLPAQFYEPHVGTLAAATDLQAALTVCHGLWQRRTLHQLFSMYVSSLTTAPLMIPGVEGPGGGPGGAAQAQQADLGDARRYNTAVHVTDAMAGSHPAHQGGPSTDFDAGNGNAESAAAAMLQQPMLQQPVLQLLAAQMAAGLPGGAGPAGHQHGLSTNAEHLDAVAALASPAGVHNGGQDQAQHLQSLYYTLQNGDLPAGSPSLMGGGVLGMAPGSVGP